MFRTCHYHFQNSPRDGALGARPYMAASARTCSWAVSEIAPAAAMSACVPIWLPHCHNLTCNFIPLLTVLPDRILLHLFSQALPPQLDQLSLSELFSFPQEFDHSARSGVNAPCLHSPTLRIEVVWESINPISYSAVWDSSNRVGVLHVISTTENLLPSTHVLVKPLLSNRIPRLMAQSDSTWRWHPRHSDQSHPGLWPSQECLIRDRARLPLPRQSCSPLLSGRASLVPISIAPSWSGGAAWIYFTKSISMASLRSSTTLVIPSSSCGRPPARSRLPNPVRPFSFRRNARRPTLPVGVGRTERLTERAPGHGVRAALGLVISASA